MRQTLKKRAALWLHRFIRYGTAEQVKNQPGIHPTVMVMPDAQVAPGVSIGRYTYIRSGARLDAGRIGAFCSIAPDVIVGGDEHPLDAVSTHPFWYAPGGLTLPDEPQTGPECRPAWTSSVPPPVIGSDVWIAAGARILRGAVIEDGAVIGAGAVVKGRVPAYGIAVGVPARTVRYRFGPELRERLRATRWWEWEEAEIRRLKPYFHDPALFLEHAEQSEAQRRARSGQPLREAVET